VGAVAGRGEECPDSPPQDAKVQTDEPPELEMQSSLGKTLTLGLRGPEGRSGFKRGSPCREITFFLITPYFQVMVDSLVMFFPLTFLCV